MNFTKLLSAAAVKPLILGTAHNVTVNEIDGMVIRTAVDLAYVHHRLPYITGTFVPPAERGVVVHSLDRLSTRVNKSGLLQADIDEVVPMISKGIRTIQTQPEKMPGKQNGAGKKPATATTVQGIGAGRDQHQPQQHQQHNSAAK